MSFKHVNYRSATTAGIVGMVLMIIVLALFGMNVLKGMGHMVGATGAGAYVVGIVLHLFFGIVYALIYALFVEKWLRSLPRGLAGATYSLFPFLMAILFMAPFIHSMQVAFNSPQADSDRVCNYEGEEGCSTCDMHKKMPYNPPRESGRSRIMCQPEGRAMCASGLAACLGSFVGHLVYGISLGLMYHHKNKK